ncbi:hypothetical protein FXO37_23879 [Capsicum annuum]|nr:hypothetical protein FXO37_23879 [Capsicum annuum]
MDLFAKRSLLSIALAIGKPIAVDKSTQVRSRSSTARVRVILDLMDKHLDRIRLQSMDKITGKIIEEFQKSLMDTLDTSTCDIRSSFMESIGEQWDKFGYKLLFKGNEQDMNGVVVLTPTHSNNKVEGKSDQKNGTNIKSWADMAGDEKQASSSPICSKLSSAASEVVPIYAMILPSLAAEQLMAQTSAPLNAMDNPTKEFQAKRYDPRELIENPMKAFEGDLGVEIFDEKDEDEVLDECFAKVARDRDLHLDNKERDSRKRRLMKGNIVGMVKCLKRLF